MIDFDQVRLVDVSRHYGRRRAVSRITFSARRGDIVGLLGPNGAGKSTLIGLVATLVTPSTGEIRYGDRDARSLGVALRAQIGLLAHELHLYPELSARQNLAFFARLHGLDAGQTVDLALERAGLERALLHQPRLVLLDEPFTGLDDRAVSVVAERLSRLAADGTIVILATHDLDVADGLATRLAIIRAGRLVADEPGGLDLRRRYRAMVGGS